MPYGRELMHVYLEPVTEEIVTSRTRCTAWCDICLICGCYRQRPENTSASYTYCCWHPIAVRPANFTLTLSVWPSEYSPYRSFFALSPRNGQCKPRTSCRPLGLPTWADPATMRRETSWLINSIMSTSAAWLKVPTIRLPKTFQRHSIKAPEDSLPRSVQRASCAGCSISAVVGHMSSSSRRTEYF